MSYLDFMYFQTVSCPAFSSRLLGDVKKRRVNSTVKIPTHWRHVHVRFYVCMYASHACVRSVKSCIYVCIHVWIYVKFESINEYMCLYMLTCMSRRIYKNITHANINVLQIKLCRISRKFVLSFVQTCVLRNMQDNTEWRTRYMIRNSTCVYLRTREDINE